MSWVAVTKKDFRDAIRSPYFWAVTAAITLVVGFFLFQVVTEILDLVREAEQANNQDIELTTDLFVSTLRFGLQPLVPVLAIVVAYPSIAGERDSGTLKLLLSLPNSRLDVLVGKLLGRSGVIMTPMLIAFAVGALAFPLSEFTFVPATYAAFVVLTLLLGIVFVAFGLGISAAASTGRRSAIAAFGIFAYLVFLWDGLAQNLASLLGRLLELSRSTALQLELFIRLLNPMAAYRTLVYRIQISGPIEARAILLTRDARPDELSVQRFMMRSVFRDSVPWYFSDAMVVVLMLLWLVIPLVLGYYLFERADL